MASNANMLKMATFLDEMATVLCKHAALFRNTPVGPPTAPEVSESKGKKVKKAKDPNKPKRPLSGCTICRNNQSSTIFYSNYLMS